jgi:hypothetical protein
MSRPGSVGSRQGPSSEGALPTAQRAEHGAKDEGRPRRDPGKQQAAGVSRERGLVDPRIAVGDLGQLVFPSHHQSPLLFGMSRSGSVGSRQGPSSERDKAAVLAAFQRFVQQALGFSRSGGSE